jgi:hypothetical protein
MSIGISEEHVELGRSLRSWAASLQGSDLVRAAETDPDAAFEEVWAALGEMGVPTIGLAEGAGGGGGSVLDVAVALEACAHALVPGPLLGPAVAAVLLADNEVAPALGRSAVVGIAIGEVVWDAPSATHVLVDDGSDSWRVVPRAAVHIDSTIGIDLSRRFGTLRAVDTSAGVAVPGLTTELVRRTAVTLAAAEASGVARWCLSTAVEHALVREQFGKPIGSFQAVKHLCAEMLETAEAVTAAAWDVASAADGDDEQWTFAADVAAAVAFDGAVDVAKSCIQVLGGIGFTFEHDAHLYLRRAIALRGLLAGGDAAAERLTARAVGGARRAITVDLEGRDESIRDEVRGWAEKIAAMPVDRQRAGLVESGYLVPHWPRPYGVGADAVTQVVIDEELARVGIARPDLVIAGWALPTIIEHGTDAQRERFVVLSLLGELEWCQLFSEPEAGSDLASLRTRAERVEPSPGSGQRGGWRLTGQKVWNSIADRADWGICLARTDPDVARHRGISYFLVDMTDPGIEVRPLREITGEALFNEVFLDGVFVPDELVVGEAGDGWRLARTTLANERVAMGSARLDRSVERAIERAASGVTAGQRVAVGRAVALATVCALLGVRATLRSVAGQPVGAESSVAKLLGVRSRQEAAELVVSLHGDRVALGDSEEVRADVWELLNTRCLSIAGGTTQILRNVVGERILGLPR